MQFVGEGADDVGGPYHQSIRTMVDELHSLTLPLLIPIPNGRIEGSETWAWDPLYKGDRYLLIDTSVTSAEILRLFRFIGILMGISIRSAAPIKLRYFPCAPWLLLATSEACTLWQFSRCDTRPDGSCSFAPIVWKQLIRHRLQIKDLEQASQSPLSLLTFPFALSPSSVVQYSVAG